MIRLVTGTPGSGKTLYLVHLLIEELLWTERTIVTNIPIQRANLLGYVEKNLESRSEWKDRVIDLDQRIVAIDLEQSFEFFRYRSDGLILPSPPDFDDNGQRLHKREFENRFNEYVKPIFNDIKTSKPVTYLLSEAHRFFATADWASVGRSAQAYLTHHRHLHDEVVFDTQHYEQLAKQLRLLIAECWVMENQYNQKFGPFRKRPGFVRKGYLARPTGSLPFETARFQLDASGVASCYQSTGALGELGDRGPEEKRRIKGLPWWSLWAFSGVGIVVICLAIMMLPKLTGSMIGGFIGGVSKGASEKLVHDSSIEKTGDGSVFSGRPKSDLDPGPEIERVYIETLRVIGSRVELWLTDGRFYDEFSSDLHVVKANRVKVGNHWYRSKPYELPVSESE